MTHIYAVQYSVSYDISGDERILSYHASEEGAHIAMDKESRGYTRKDSFNGTYYYVKDNECLAVIKINVEE